MTNECPRLSLTPDVQFVLRLYAHYQAGHLWEAGGVASQPNIYLDAMRIVENWSHKLQS